MGGQRGSSQSVIRISQKAYDLWVLVQQKREAAGLPPFPCDKKIEIKKQRGRKNSRPEPREENPDAEPISRMPEFMIEEPYSEGIMRSRNPRKGNGRDFSDY